MTTPSASTNLLDLLPPWYAEVADFGAICSAEQPAFTQIQAYMLQVLANFFPQTMDADSIGQWEQILGILADPSAESLDFRRQRIINRISTRPPFTLQFLYNKLDELVGPGLWSVDVDYANYTLYITTNAEPQAYSQEVEFTINRIKPAHIVYAHKAVAESIILVGEQVQYTRYGWNYKLGSWQLGALPFAGILENEVVKTAAQPSVQPIMLQNLTGYTADDIVSAQVNGSIAVANITKEQTGDVLTVSYPISTAQTAEITQVALLASDGTALFSAPVYIPVTDTVTATHSITIQEGATSNASS